MWGYIMVANGRRGALAFTLWAGLLLGLAKPVEAGDFAEYSDLSAHIIGILPKDGIPAITNPAFVEPEKADWLLDDDLVLGVVLGGEARAYPQNLGWWHEVINDRIGDRAISVTFCPLTGTGLVFDATDKDGSQIELGVSGLLINSNLVLYDRRDERSLYPQMIYTGISGEFAGQTLELLPVVETTWGLWKKLYPQTRVAQRNTGLDAYSQNLRNHYERTRGRYEENQGGYPYGDYRTNDQYLLYAPTTFLPDLSLYGTKDVVLGVCDDGETKAYPFRDLPDGAVINDVVGLQPLVVVYDADSRTAIPYASEVEGQARAFYAVPAEDGLPVQFRDVGTRSLWNMRGEAVAGPLRGARLRQVAAYNSMWFAWHTYWPDTEVWAGEGLLSEAELPPFESTAVVETLPDGRPHSFSLEQNRPNPFNPNTLIRFSLAEAGPARLEVYNAVGQRVRLLLEGYRGTGVYEVSWDGVDAAGRPAASGLYFYRLAMPAHGLLQARSMTLVR